MSWSVNVNTGSKEDVAKRAAEQFDTAAKSYAGTAEGEDIKAAKERALSLLDRMAPGEGEDVQVQAYGSHSVGNGGLRAASFSVAVSVKS